MATSSLFIYIYFIRFVIVCLFINVSSFYSEYFSDFSEDVFKSVNLEEDPGESDEFQRPWQLNRNVCPPILCRPIANEIKLDNINRTKGFLSAPIPIKYDRFPFFEGDIVLDSELRQQITRHGQLTRVRRSVVAQTSRLWTDAVVPYDIDTDVDDKTRKLILVAIQHIMNNTCLKFREKNQDDVDYVTYISQPGCWSYIGKIGGEQFVSLGAGCEHFGTILHETTHSLGFWHEQSRPDRDEYVEIVSENIAERNMEQFSKRTTNESWSRGYAYDYMSIMHYADSDYSENGEPTIKLIGIGAEKRFRIGQRKRLSDLDIAQLNTIYNCTKQEKEEKACPPGWIKHKFRCYYFAADDRLSFVNASRKCRTLKGRLLKLDNKDEDHFIKNYLQENFPYVDRWKTAGIKYRGGEFVWHVRGSRGKNQNMTYTAWPTGKPGEFTALVLKLNNMSIERRVEWSGDWYRGTNQTRLPFICERKAKPICFQSKTSDGRDYRGTLSYSSKLAVCQRWSRQYPHSHSELSGNATIDRTEGLGDHNYCRNPGGRRKRPWCYVLLKDAEWQYCDVNICKNRQNRARPGTSF